MSSAGLLHRSAWAHDDFASFYCKGQIRAKSEFVIIIYPFSIKYKTAIFLWINSILIIRLIRIKGAFGVQWIAVKADRKRCPSALAAR